MDKEVTRMADVRNQFEQAGFQIVEIGKSPQTIAVKKYNCTRYLECNSVRGWVPSGPPYYNIRGLDCELEDHGYQKFWFSKGKRFPIRQTDLKVLHRFDEEVRNILGLKSLYHESLGSTCARSAYDRLKGRGEK